MTADMLHALHRLALIEAREAKTELDLAHLCHLADALETEAWAEEMGDDDGEG